MEDKSYFQEQLEAKNDMLARTTDYMNQIENLLTEKNLHLVDLQRGVSDSINFAKLIQTSLLPDANILKVFFKDAAYKVVQKIGIGGDTIFIKNTNSGIIFCLLDATGHGIPGAMLSISGTLILNDIISSIEIDDPAVLLKFLNYRLHKTFRNDKNSIAHFEGIVFYYSSINNKLSYSSAKGKGFLFNSTGDIISLASSKTSIGENLNTNFDTFDVPFQKGEKLILFSDGLIDQFGGEQDKKYTTFRLKKLLVNNSEKTVSELIEIIYEECFSWKGDGGQTDDLSFKIIEF